MESLLQTLGRRLKLLRKSKELTQEQLGSMADVDYKHIGAIERGVKTPSLEAIERIAKALKVDYYELFLPDKSLAGQISELDLIVKDMRRHCSPEMQTFLVQILNAAKELQNRK